MTDDMPADSALDHIANAELPDLGALDGVVAAAIDAWSDHGKVTRVGHTVTFVTGGWSGNEAVIDAMRRNQVFWAVCWVSSHRNGTHVFSLRM